MPHGARIRLNNWRARAQRREHAEQHRQGQGALEAAEQMNAHHLLNIALNNEAALQLPNDEEINPHQAATEHNADHEPNNQADLHLVVHVPQAAEEHEMMELDPIPSPPPQQQIPEDMIDEEPHQFAPPHCLGQMNNKCPPCRAKYFQEEVNSEGYFTKCCYRGVVNLPPVQAPPQNVMQLFTSETADSRHFLQKNRHYNATLNEHAGRGPRVVTIHGQSYHLKAAQEAAQGQLPQYAQLYILDTNEAVQQRVNDPCNQNILPNIIQLVQDELMAVNPYARQYRNMGEVLQRERQIAAANNQPLAPVRMIIATHPFQDRCFDNPTASEIAAVYVGDDGASPAVAKLDQTEWSCY